MLDRKVSRHIADVKEGVKGRLINSMEEDLDIIAFESAASAGSDPMASHKRDTRLHRELTYFTVWFADDDQSKRDVSDFSRMPTEATKGPLKPDPLVSLDLRPEMTKRPLLGSTVV